jgi:SAM-dependent methyltransferase
VQNTEQYYDHFATTYEDGRDSRYHRFLDDAEVRLTTPHAEGRDVLEVGCGTGLILERLAKIASQARGVDLSAGMLEKARARGLNVVQGSATELPFPDASFDVACSFKVLAHVPDLQQALSEMARVVRPGGVIIAELYNQRSLRTLVKRLKTPTAIGSGDVSDEDVYTRYDRLDDVQAALPSSLTLERIDGIRILSPLVAPFHVPLLGPAWRWLEEMSMRTPLRRWGGFMVLTLRRH